MHSFKNNCKTIKKALHARQKKSENFSTIFQLLLTVISQHHKSTTSHSQNNLSYKLNQRFKKCWMYLWFLSVCHGSHSTWSCSPSVTSDFWCGASQWGLSRFTDVLTAIKLLSYSYYCTGCLLGSLPSWCHLQKLTPKIKNTSGQLRKNGRLLEDYCLHISIETFLFK